MGPTTLGVDDLRLVLILLAPIGLGMVGTVLHTRYEWRALRHMLFRPVDSLKWLSLPGRLEERLGAERWDCPFRETLSRSRRDFLSEGRSDVAAAMEAVERDRERLAPMVREVARCAMIDGEVRSVLVRLDDVLVYILTFPGSADDKRSLRKCGALAGGWTTHARAVRGAAEQVQSVPMISLLFFLGLDARSGTLLVAYEGDGGSVLPAALVSPADGQASGSTVSERSYEFLLG